MSASAPAEGGRREAIIMCLGVAIALAALAGDEHWLDRHFLPSFFFPRGWYVLVHAAVRVAIAVLGIAVAASARALAARLTPNVRVMLLQTAVAAALALGASEAVLRRMNLRPLGWLVPDDEPKRRPDPRLGWTLEPARTGRSTIGGRTVEYALDAHGYRVRSAGDVVDPERPAILFVGESVMFGEGLTWDETIPAQVGAMLHVQSANLAVHGYSTDQAYLRLAQELPRFRAPVAVVPLFMSTLLGRNFDDDRPRVASGMVWMPAKRPARLRALVQQLVPYRRDATVERGIALTREVLGVMTAMARARGAASLIVVPQLGPESSIERTLRRRVLDDGALPYVFVETDAGWRMPWNLHPNAQAAHAIAEQVAGRLERLIRHAPL